MAIHCIGSKPFGYWGLKTKRHIPRFQGLARSLGYAQRGKPLVPFYQRHKPHGQVVPGAVGGQVAVEAVDEFQDNFGGGHL